MRGKNADVTKAYLTVALVLGWLATGSADTLWTGNGGNAFYNTTGNWNPATAPVTTTITDFPDVANQIIDLNGANRAVGTATFTAADTYTFQGSGAHP